MTPDTALVQSLRRHIVDEVIRAFGLPRIGWTRFLFGWLMHIPSERFSQLGASFDAWLAESGLACAARQALAWFVDSYRTIGAESVPASGPLIIAGNHPGTFDSLVILASLARQDVKVIASNMPFVRTLPNAQDHLLYASADTYERSGMLRQAIRHLEEGGALLIFPAGQIEPDPEVFPGAREALERWSPSVGLMMRRVREARLVVTISSGVLARKCARHPITWLRKGGHESRRLAEFLQISQQLLFNRRFGLTPKVSFGQPLFANELGSEGLRRLHDSIVAWAAQAMDQHMSTWHLASPS